MPDHGFALLVLVSDQSQWANNCLRTLEGKHHLGDDAHSAGGDLFRRLQCLGETQYAVKFITSDAHVLNSFDIPWEVLFANDFLLLGLVYAT